MSKEIYDAEDYSVFIYRLDVKEMSLTDLGRTIGSLEKVLGALEMAKVFLNIEESPEMGSIKTHTTIKLSQLYSELERRDFML